MLGWWFGNLRFKRRTERVRKALGFSKDWGVIGEIATRIGWSPLSVVSSLINDGLAKRAGDRQRTLEEKELQQEEAAAFSVGPVSQSPYSLFWHLCISGGGELRVWDDGARLRCSWRRPDGGVEEFNSWNYMRAISGDYAEQYLVRMRMLADAELLDQDAPAYGSIRFRVPGQWFHVAATVLPQGRCDGLRATVFATPEDSTPAPHEAAPVRREAAEHYTWSSGGGAPVCDGWRLMNSPGVSVIQERVPAGGSEQRHSHAVTRQFFYLLSGTLTVEVDGNAHTLTAGQGIEVPPGAAHQVRNDSDAGDAEFLVVSNPGNSRADRIPDPAP